MSLLQAMLIVLALPVMGAFCMWIRERNRRGRTRQLGGWMSPKIDTELRTIGHELAKQRIDVFLAQDFTDSEREEMNRLMNLPFLRGIDSEPAALVDLETVEAVACVLLLMPTNVDTQVKARMLAGSRYNDNADFDDDWRKAVRCAKKAIETIGIVVAHERGIVRGSPEIPIGDPDGEDMLCPCQGDMIFIVEQGKGALGKRRPTMDELKAELAMKLPVCPDCGKTMRKEQDTDVDGVVHVVWRCDCEPSFDEEAP